MKLIKILIALILIITLLAIATFYYFDRETITLNNKTRVELGGTYTSLPIGVVHYEIAGPKEGEVVVLVHGFSVPSFIWEPTFQFLKENGYRVLRFDLFGRGYSDRPDEEYGLELFSKQIRGVLHALAIEKPINLVGLSMGGPIVTRFTNDNPKKVKRLILQDPLVHQIPQSTISPVHLPMIGELLANVLLIPNLIKGNQDKINEQRVPGWGARFAEQAKIKGFRKGLLSSIRYFSSQPLIQEYESLSKSNIPKLLIWGSHDQVIPISEAKSIIDLIPKIQYNIIDGAGHVPSVEKPEAFNEILLNFLENH